MVSLMECLTWVTPQEMALLMDPRNGIATVCKYLPTPGDIHEFLKARDHKPAPTSYKKLTEESGPWDQETDFERKKRVVLEALGYNPGERNAPKRDLVPPTAADLDGVIKGLKTSPAPASEELRRLIAEQDAR
jgi:hypothetical protein